MLPHLYTPVVVLLLLYQLKAQLCMCVDILRPASSTTADLLNGGVDVTSSPILLLLHYAHAHAHLRLSTCTRTHLHCSM